MSRSIKKNMGGSITGAGMKSDQKVYHQAERAKVNSLLNQIKKENGEGDTSDKLVKNRVDYGVKYSDNWSWGSDGGSYIQETDKSLSEYYDKHLLNNDNVWDDYQNHVRYHRTWWIVNRAFTMTGEKIESKEELMQWLKDNKEKVIRAVKKIDFGK